jgi:hypothetical protein
MGIYPSVGQTLRQTQAPFPAASSLCIRVLAVTEWRGISEGHDSRRLGRMASPRRQVRIVAYNYEPIEGQILKFGTCRKCLTGDCPENSWAAEETHA